MEFTQPQYFTGISTLFLSDATALRDERRYSIRLVPWYDPNRRPAIGSWVELRDEEPLRLEGEPVTVRLSDGRSFTLQVTDVSDTPPHQHTLAVEQWPSAAPEAV